MYRFYFRQAGALEGQLILWHNRRIALSEQELVDCSGSYGTLGCKGGWMWEAFKYVKDYGLASSDSYPYTTAKGTCYRESTARADLKLTGYTRLAADEETLRQAVGK